ncbi:quinone oxidoreductase family protein [Hyalangium rubrum]|uniref:Quinone oxidoreductase n=1 Tax=Hyalangium rubrum TaxID=3103134 RepID=A0ABU5HEZ2_9BACT|nr:quinone oxidoreductase [Hyalangium sp. s54d21]MDY7231727.1 quinone oxidoreductase [Hyalangium sp. s54d21]
MKAIRYHETGGPEVLRFEEVPEPAPGPGEVLLQVHATGVNFADTERRRGLYDTKVPLPRILGSEAAGIVTAVGAGVDPALVGRRVVTLTVGSYAEVVKAQASGLVLLPESVSFEVAAAVPVQGLTAYHLLRTVGQVREGQSVLVHAAAGGVGVLAVQLAKAAGARVFGTVSSEAKARLIQELGVEEVIRYDREDVVAEVHKRTGGRGVDLVLDAVGASTWAGSLQALALFGHLVSYGSASGPPPPVDVEALFAKSLKVSAYWLHTPHPPGLHHRALEELVREVAEQRLRILIGLKLPLAEAAEAHRRLEGRETVGKVVLTVRSPESPRYRLSGK